MEKDFYKGLIESYNTEGSGNGKKSTDGCESVATSSCESVKEESIPSSGSESSSSEPSTSQMGARKKRNMSVYMTEESGDDELFQLPLHICESSLNIHILDKSVIAALLELEPMAKKQFLSNESWGYYSDADIIPLFGV